MKKIISNIKENYEQIPYTFKHKVAMWRLEKQYTNKNTTRILLHDTDKLLICFLLPVLNPNFVQYLHQSFAKHHKYKNHNKSILQEITLDWESARYTKPDKPLSCRDFCLKFKPEMFKFIEPILNEWGI